MRFVELCFAECHESCDRGLKDIGRQRGAPRQASVHQRAYPPSSCHVVRHWQCGCEFLLDEQVEDLVRVRGWPAEDALAERLRRSESFEGLWICISDDLV